MNICPWGKINDFQSLSEFNRFVGWMDEQVNAGVAEEIAVERPYVGATFKEKWYRHSASKEVWRLVWPDSPFTGVFERVE